MTDALLGSGVDLVWERAHIPSEGVSRPKVGRAVSRKMGMSFQSLGKEKRRDSERTGG